MSLETGDNFYDNRAEDVGKLTDSEMVTLALALTAATTWSGLANF